LNRDNLLRIIHRVVVASHKDIDNLRDDTKESGMILDIEDTEYLVENVLAELRKEQA